MSEVLAAKHEPMAITSLMLESLQGMFGQPSERQRHEALVLLMTAKMKEETSIRENVLRMMTYFNMVKTHTGRIYELAR